MYFILIPAWQGIIDLKLISDTSQYFAYDNKLFRRFPMARLLVFRRILLKQAGSQSAFVREENRGGEEDERPVISSPLLLILICLPRLARANGVVRDLLP